MDLLERLERGETSLAVVGLGYVGLPLAVAFARQFHVIGYDQNAAKVAALAARNDPTGVATREELQLDSLECTSDPARLREAQFVLVAVPTPVHADKTPDLSPVTGATRTVGAHLAKGSIVVYESTVYPGVTEDVCVPILEAESGLSAGRDFKVGYSPERINPGDKVHTLQNIVKIVSGQDEASRATIAAVYARVVDTVFPVSSIRVAEAAKLVENTQRDVNIAFLNELSLIFHRMGIDTQEVVRAMDTKWNALGFRPGLVGGHCIGVDPYYLIHQAERYGVHPRLVAESRQTNDGMADFIVRATVRELVRAKTDLKHARVYVLGMTFKENCPDVRNSRAVDIYEGLSDYALEPIAVDPVADRAALIAEHEVRLVSLDEVRDADALVILVAHAVFCAFSWDDLDAMYAPNGAHVLVDAKQIFAPEEACAHGYHHWSL